MTAIKDLVCACASYSVYTLTQDCFVKTSVLYTLQGSSLISQYKIARFKGMMLCMIQNLKKIHKRSKTDFDPSLMMRARVDSEGGVFISIRYIDPIHNGSAQALIVVEAMITSAKKKVCQ